MTGSPATVPTPPSPPGRSRDGGPSAIPALPAKGVYYDSTLSVTYWLPERDEALSC